MKTSPIRIPVQKRPKAARTFSGTLSGFTLAVITLSPLTQAQAASVLTVDLGSASSFAILAGTGITISDAPGTVINGDIGSYPTATIVGLENATLNGVNHGGDGVTQTAKNALVLAYDDAADRPANFNYASGFNLSGTLEAGVHRSAGSFAINGQLTLDAGGNSDMVWIFQSASTLDAASGSQVILTNGALASNVFWQVGSSATLLSTADFSGSILADQSISMTTDVEFNGGAYALNGAVSIGSVVITVPEPSAPIMLGLAASGFCLLRRARSGGQA